MKTSKNEEKYIIHVIINYSQNIAQANISFYNDSDEVLKLEPKVAREHLQQRRRISIKMEVADGEKTREKRAGGRGAGGYQLADQQLKLKFARTVRCAAAAASEEAEGGELESVRVRRLENQICHASSSTSSRFSSSSFVHGVLSRHSFVHLFSLRLAFLSFFLSLPFFSSFCLYREI